MKMRKRFGWIWTAILLTLALSVAFAACKGGDPSGEGGEGTPAFIGEVVFVDAGGNELFTVTEADLANSVKRYDAIGGIANVYTWNCVVTGADGTREVTVIRDGRLEVETVRGLLTQQIDRLEIYPAAYFTLLTYGQSEYKAVCGQVPTAIPAAEKTYHLFAGYYAVIEGIEVQLTDAAGSFLKKWEYTMPTLTLVPHFDKVEIALRIDYVGGDYTAEDEAAGRGYLTTNLSAPNKIKIGDSLDFLRAPAREGFTFDGWYSGSLKVTDGRLSFDYNTSRVTDAFDIAGTVTEGYTLTLTANWVRNDVLVVFRRMVNVSTNENAILSTRTSKYGFEIPFAQSGLVGDYCSVVWKDSSGTVYQERATLPVSDLTLYAYTKLHKKLVTDADGHTSLVAIEDCEDVECYECGKQVTHKIPHEYDLEYRVCRNRECTRCHYIEKNDAPHTYVNDWHCVDRTCTVCGEIDNASEPHKFDETSISSWICLTCGKNLLEEYGYYREANSTKVHFGSYPSELVDDSDELNTATLAALNALVTDVSRDETGWTAFDFGTTYDEANAWYQDVKVDEDKYRVICVVAGYREGARQEENGVRMLKKYWFKYANLTWTIVNERDCVVTMLSDKILDCGNVDYAAAWAAAFSNFFGENNSGYFVENGVLLPEASGTATYTDYAKYLGLNLDGDVASYLTTADASTMDNSTGIRPMLRIKLFPESNSSVTLIKGVGVDKIYYYTMEEGNEKALDTTYSFDLGKTKRIYYRATPAYGYTIDKSQHYGKFEDANQTVELSGSPVSVTITFDAAGGEGRPTTVTATFDAAIDSITPPTKACYRFEGYYIVDGDRRAMVVDAQGHFLPNAGSDGVGENGKPVRDTYLKNGVLKMAKDFTLVALWSDAIYTIEYDANGGVGTMAATTDCRYFSSVSLRANAFTKTGYRFGGWVTDPSAETAAFTDGQSVRSLVTTDGGSITLYALWLPIEYTVSYDKNALDATGTTPASAHKYDSARALSANAYARTGYTFLGWGESADVEEVTYQGGAEVLNLTTTHGATVTFYAIWAPIHYTVTYHANGGEGQMEPSACVYDVAKTLSANTFTRAGYEFDGWAHAADAADGILSDEETVKNLASTDDAVVTLYAVWAYCLTYRLEEPANGDKYYVVTGLGSNDQASIKIPATRRGIAVKEIAQEAFSGHTELTSVTIPESVTSIGYEAFRECTSLTGITIGSGVTNIGGGAFRESALTSITIPAGVTTINKFTFKNCKSLTSISLPEGIKSMDYQSIFCCEKLTSITIPNSVTNIGDEAFCGCVNLATVTFGNGSQLTTIGTSVFRNCTSLTSVVIPDSVTSIGANVLAGCGALESLAIPFVGNRAGVQATDTYQYPLGYLFGTVAYEGSFGAGGNFWMSSTSELTNIVYQVPTSLRTVTVMGGYLPRGAFAQCVMLTRVTLGDGVTRVGECAFNPYELDWPELTVVFGSSVTSIDAYAFDKHPSLTTITLPSSLKVIGAYAFRECPLTSIVIPNGVERIDTFAFNGCNGLTSVTIPDSVTTIGGSAFRSCLALTSVTIGSGVTSIGENVFRNCGALESLTIPFVGNRAGVTKDDTYQYPFGYLFGTSSYDGGTGIKQGYYAESTSEQKDVTFYIPASLRSVIVLGGYVPYNAFVRCSMLTSIVLCEGVPAIGKDAFWDCSGLTSFTIPASVTSIEERIFHGCSVLESLTIPFIGNRAGVTVTDTQQYPLGYLFGTDSYTGSQGAAGNFWIKGSDAPSHITYQLPASLRSVTVTGGGYIPTGAFYSCTMLERITLIGVNAIGRSAFNAYLLNDGWGRRLTLVLENCPLTAIGSFAFEKNDGVQGTFEIPATVTQLGDNPFSGAGFTSITVASGNTKYHVTSGCLIENETGRLVHALEGAVIPTDGSVTAIGVDAFCHRPSLISLTIPATVTAIAKTAFYKCTSLISITIPASMTSIGERAFEYCSSLKDIYFGGTEAQWSAISKGSNWHRYAGDFTVHYASQGLAYTLNGSAYTVTGIGTYTGTSLVVPAYYEGKPVTAIAANAFKNATALTSVVIPDTVTSIGENAFAGCGALVDLTIPFVGNRAGVTRNNTNQYPLGYLFGTEAYTGSQAVTANYFLSSSNGTTEKTYQVPASLRTVTVTGGGYIPRGAFAQCVMLSKVTLCGVTRIGECAFNGYNVDWERPFAIEFIGCALTNIDGYAFEDCNTLSQPFVIPTGCTLGDNPFCGTCSFTSITVEEGNTQYHIANNCLIETSSKRLVHAFEGAVIPTDGSVTSIGSGAFSGRNLTSVVIPNTITTIGHYGFSNCELLTSVTMPNTVTSMGNCTFRYCDKLNSITLSSGIKSIGNEVFRGCTSLISITLPSSVTSIGGSAFKDCTSLTSINFPSGLKTIGSSAFKNCDKITSITIPASVTEIGNAAFEDCEILSSFTFANGSPLTKINDYTFKNDPALTSIVLPSGVTSIGYQAFHRNLALTSVTLPSSLMTIGKYAFNECTALPSIALPASLKTIDSFAFYRCYALDGVTLPSGLTTIADRAFSECSSLTLIAIPASVTEIGIYAFDACAGLTSITVASGNTVYHSADNCLIVTATKTLLRGCKNSVIPSNGSVTTLDDSAFWKCTTLTSISIPSGVTKIDRVAFEYCDALTSITIPVSVTTFGEKAFRECLLLADIYYEGTEAQWNAITKGSNWAQNAGKNTSKGTYTLHYSNGLTYALSGSNYSVTGIGTFSGTALVIPSEYHGKAVTSIAANAFNNATTLTSVTLPNTVTSIGNYAFSGCSNITSFSLGTGLRTIGYYAFNNCTKVTSITIPSAVTSIQHDAFSGCIALTSLTIPASVMYIGTNLVANCTALATITVASGNTKYKSSGNCLISISDKSVIAGCKNSVIPTDGSVTTIGKYSFYGHRKLTSITIPYTITSIENYAFYNCTGLTSVVIPISVMSIGKYAFAGCSNIATYYYAGSSSMCSQVSIGIGCFDGVGSNVPGGVVSASLADSLSYTLNGNVYTVSGIGTFNRSDLVIPSTYNGKAVTAIAANAFKNKTGLTSVYIPTSVTSIGSAAFQGCSSLVSMTVPFAGSHAIQSKTETNQYPFGYIFGTSSYTGGQAAKGYFWISSTSSTTETTYYVPASLRTVTVTGGYLPRCAFAECTMLTKVILESGVTGIGESAFNPYEKTWASLSVTIGNGVKSIDYCAFDNNRGLTSITIPSSVKSIGQTAFRHTSLTTVTIPSSVTSIGSAAFQDCSSLVSMTIPFVGGSAGKTASSTYQYPFGYIFGTSSYTGGVATTQPYYGSSTSQHTEATFYIPASLRSVTVLGGYIPYDGFEKCTMLTSITLCEGVTSIGKDAFWMCSTLTSITIPSTVTSIGERAFHGCTGLTSMTIPFVGSSATATEASGSTLFGYIFGTNSYGGGTSKQQYYGSSSSVTYYIPSALRRVTVTGGKILRGAFYGCSMLTSITLPSTLTTIGYYAFYNCSGLTSVTIPSSVTSIGYSAFQGCSALASVSFASGSSLLTVDNFAFHHCDSLTSITLPSSVTSIGNDAFGNCSKLASVTLSSNLQRIGYYAFENCVALTSVMIPSSVTIIYSYVFIGCTKLTAVTFQNTSGWWVATSSSESSGTSVTVTNAATNVTNLKETYKTYVWRRS